jgi:Leucine-rich repeat (LRR) protein
MTTEIETYLNSLSEDISELNVNDQGITSLPDLTIFKNLKKLYCFNNKLTSLPTLPQNLQILYCSGNQLTLLPTLPQNLKRLYCYNNKLTSLPTLLQNLQILYCSGNQLTLLPTLPQNLKKLVCYNNQLTLLPTLPQNLESLNFSTNKLTYLPTLPKNLKELYFYNNPIYKIVNGDRLLQIKKNIQIINNFRNLYYCLKFKKQFRKWLWEKVREPKVKIIYNPNYLIENLGYEDDLDEILNNWK